METAVRGSPRAPLRSERRVAARNPPSLGSYGGETRRVACATQRVFLLCGAARINLAWRIGNEFADLTETWRRPTALNPGEEAQLQQTIEMFEVIVQSQPTDTQSLEILKEAYSKLGREEELVHTSKRIAQAYLQQGQLSSAILEYETVLQRRPEDADVQAALKQIEDRASNAAVQSSADLTAPPSVTDTQMLRRKAKARAVTAEEVDDGRKSLHKIFVDSKLITAGDFDLCWRNVDLTTPPTDVVQPFIQTLHEKGIYPHRKIAPAAVRQVAAGVSAAGPL